MTDDIHVNKLYQVRMQKDYERTRVYQQVYAKLVSKIIQSNNQEYTDLLFTMEPIILGEPLYNMKCCIAFMMYKLRKNGMVAKYIYPNVLFVSWRVDVTQPGGPPAVPQHSQSQSQSGNQSHSHSPHSQPRRDSRVSRISEASMSESTYEDDLELECLIASKKIK